MLDPLLLKPEDFAKVIGGGRTTTFELIRTGDVESVTIR